MEKGVSLIGREAAIEETPSLIPIKLSSLDNNMYSRPVDGAG